VAVPGTNIGDMKAVPVIKLRKIRHRGDGDEDGCIKSLESSKRGGRENIFR